MDKNIKEEISDIRTKILIGLKKTYEDLIESKKKNGGAIAIYENGKIVVKYPKNNS